MPNTTMQVIIVIIQLLSVTQAAFAADGYLQLLPRSTTRNSQFNLRYIENSLMARDGLYFADRFDPRSLDYSMPFSVSSHLFPRSFDYSSKTMVRRADSDLKEEPKAQKPAQKPTQKPTQKPKARTGEQPSQSSNRITRSGSLRQNSLNPSRSQSGSRLRGQDQDQASIIIKTKGKTATSNIRPHIDHDNSVKAKEQEQGLTSMTRKKLTGVARAIDPNDKIKIEASGKKVAAEVDARGPGTAVIRSYGPSDVNTKILTGGTRPFDAPALDPKYYAKVEASSYVAGKDASISVTTTGNMATRVRASNNNNDDLSFNTNSYSK